MERQLKHLWIPTLGLLLASQAFAGNSFWDQMFKKVSKTKTLELKAGFEQKPSYKLSPKLISFRGVVAVPSSINLVSGSGKVHPMSGQIIFDGQVVCNYSPKQNGRFISSSFSLTSCSDGSRSGEEMRVDQKVELKLNMAASDKASLVAKLDIVSKVDSDYGLILPYLEAEEGQVLTYNGEAWVPAFPETQTGGAGAVGPQGPQGEQGPAGAQGPKGDKGDKGDAGVAGAAGAPGVAGPMGPQGLKGDKGDAGPAGVAGAAGAAGPMGPQGPKGLDGAAGAVGPMGPQGPVGPIGPQGPKGNDGADGAPGVAGPMGPQGPKGDAGPMGPRGNDGAVGATGAQGATGPQGPAGPMGMMGMQGPKGNDGAAGAAGPMGPQGPQGLQGEKGDRGLSEIAYLRDEKGSGTNGGSCTTGGWLPRDLNTMGGDTNFISLSANRFMLQPGKYFVEITVPGYAVGAHQAKLHVIESNSDVLLGSSASTGTTSATVAIQTQNTSQIAGEIVVVSASTFEVQQRCQISRSISGFGLATGFGNNEIYTQVKIIKKQ